MGKEEEEDGGWIIEEWRTILYATKTEVEKGKNLLGTITITSTKVRDGLKEQNSGRRKNLGGDEKEIETGQENTENNFKDENNLGDTDKEEMVRYKRIYNPITRRYYKAKVHSDGTYEIVGLWHPPKTSKKKKKSIWDLLEWMKFKMFS